MALPPLFSTPPRRPRSWWSAPAASAASNGSGSARSASTCSGTRRARSSSRAEGSHRERAMQQTRTTWSSARRRLTTAAGRAGVDADEREELVGAVLSELAVRLTPAQWRELCGWLPWDVRSLAGARHADRVAPREDLVAAVAADTASAQAGDGRRRANGAGRTERDPSGEHDPGSAGDWCSRACDRDASGDRGGTSDPVRTSSASV